MDEVMKARKDLQTLIDDIRVAPKNDKLGEMALSAGVVEAMCPGGQGCTDMEHAQHHIDMRNAQRALTAAADKWVELRAHLAVASNAIKPPNDWEPKVVEPKKGDLNVN